MCSNAHKPVFFSQSHYVSTTSYIYDICLKNVKPKNCCVPCLGLATRCFYQCRSAVPSLSWNANKDDLCEESVHK